jgi:hypothetical protein
MLGHFKISACKVPVLCIKRDHDALITFHVNDLWYIQQDFTRFITVIQKPIMKIPAPAPPSPHTTWQSPCTCTVTTHQGQSSHSISSQTRDLGDAESWVFEDLLPNYPIRMGVETGRATIYDKGAKDLEMEIRNSLKETGLDKTYIKSENNDGQDDPSRKTQGVKHRVFFRLADKLNIPVAAKPETDSIPRETDILKLREENGKLKAGQVKLVEGDDGDDELDFRKTFNQQFSLLFVAICCICLVLFELFA